MNTNAQQPKKRLSTAVSDALLALGLSVLSGLSVALRAPFIIRSGGFGGGPAPAPAIPETATGLVPMQRPTLSPYSMPLAVLAFLPLALRRRFPLAVLATVTIIAAINDLLPGPPSLVFLAPLIALYTVGTLRPRRTLVIAAALTAAVQVAVSAPHYTNATFWADAVRIVAMVAVAAALGDATRNRRAYIAEVEERAAEAERTRDEVARRRVDEERLRIARELHDVTAHSLSIIAVQSGAAAHVIDSNPAEARRSLEAIRQTSKSALDELRAMLGVLRSADEADAPLAPVPGLARLAELAAPLREANIEVEMVVDEDLGDVPALVDASAYRIVQEALTNVVRHAGPCTVRVSVRRTNGDLAVEVADTGRATSATAAVSGHGLEGMRERAVALGGTFEAGPRPGGGFRVAATLPVGARGGR
jgi:signal transduction histidine kinase